MANDSTATDSTKRPSEPAEATQAAVGLIAFGSEGSWDVAVDQSVTGDENWFLHLAGPSLDLYFLIQGPQTVEELQTFLEVHQAHSPKAAGSQALQQDIERRVGTFDGNPVSFLWDEEGDGRLVILINGTNHCASRFTASARDMHDLTDAVRQVRDDLAESGLLT